MLHSYTKRQPQPEHWDERGTPRAQPNHKPHGTAATHHALLWPAAYEGEVWLKLKPWPEHQNQPHDLTLTWEPWQRYDHTTITKHGWTLVTGKAADPNGVPVTCHLDNNLLVFVLHGAGTKNLGEEPATIKDIHHGWQQLA